MTNCPATYKNIGCQNFNDGKKVTSQILRQFCKNDAYLYEQIMELWDLTDPQSKKRFYPPYFMDSGKSFGIEPCYTGKTSNNESDIDIIGVATRNELMNMDGENQTVYYHLSNSEKEVYTFNFDKSDDKTYRGTGAQKGTLYIDSDYLLEDDSTLHIVTDYDPATDTVTRKLLPYSMTDTITESIPYTVKGTKIVKTKEDVFAKKSNLDAQCSGPYKDWKCNSVWYIGYNRHKNYNVKNEWRKNPDDTSIPSVCRCQTFKAKQSGLLTKVGFMMRGSKSGASPLIVEIRSTDKKGKPTQKVLARTEQKFNHSTNSMVNFTFEKSFNLKKGTKYAIVLRSPLSQFNHCYWIGGWASSCFSNSRKRAYYDGETYLSEDNGKTWVVHGRKEKCYGSHYYDWGFAEPPVNFGFEVYVSPKIDEKEVSTTVGSDTNANYEASLTYDYYPKGDYYLNFKAFTGGRYTSFSVPSNLPTDNNDEIFSWEWELFDETTQSWKPLSSFGDHHSGNYVDWTGSKSFIKPRLKLSLAQNVLVDTDYTEEDFTDELEEIKKLKITDTTKRDNWKNDVASKLNFEKSLEYPASITFTLEKDEAPYGYLRTLFYHPEQDTMLPACIWSEVDAHAVKKGTSDVKVDVVHEMDKIERIRLLRTNNYELLKPYLEEKFSKKASNLGVTDNTSMHEFIVGSDNKLTSEGEEFYEFLKGQNPPVYFLPNGNVKYFLGKDNDCLPLGDYPAYPINNVTVNARDNITLPLDSEEFTIPDSSHIDYTMAKGDKNNISRITLAYGIGGDGSEDYIETTLTEYVKVGVNGNGKDLGYGDYLYSDSKTIRFRVNCANYITTTTEIERSTLTNFLTISGTNTYSMSLKSDSTTMKPSTANIIIEMKGWNLNEFESYLIDYENKLMKIHNPASLMEGELKINYNPLWCRGLGLDDFPLKLDLWTETYEVKEKADGYYLDKIYTVDDVDNYIYADKPYTITLSTNPRDSIRRVSRNDKETDGGIEAFEEDEHFKVDYLDKTILFDKNMFGKSINHGDKIYVKYTPNLTDNGLGLMYRLYRGNKLLEDRGNNDKDSLDILYNEEYEVDKYKDDVFIGMNSWTYRT